MSRKYEYVGRRTGKRKRPQVVLWASVGVICIFAAVTTAVLVKNGISVWGQTESAPPSSVAELSGKAPASSASPTVTSMPNEPERSSSAPGSTASGGADKALPQVKGTVPESPPVGDDYFDDAVFVGDSRTEMLQLYSSLTKPEFFAVQGMSVDKLHDKPAVNISGEKVSILDAMRQKQFAKVYIMLGLNELGWVYSDIFIQEYGDAIDEIKKDQPNAAIYVQSILPVSRKTSENNEEINNPRVVEYNTLIKQMAEEKGVYYLDVAEVMTDDQGNLFEDASTDGIHLTPEYCDVWLDYLKTHTVSK